MVGYAPSTQHVEPGWLVPLNCLEACDLGKPFHQHAMYFVEVFRRRRRAVGRSV
jgi:hypothetical protein